MKKILQLITLCCIALSLQAQSLKKPDLAYPKTVQEEAAKALKQAEKKGNGDLLVAALCQLSLADCAISKENNEKVLERLHQYQAKEKRVDIQTLLYLLEVRLYEDIWGDYAKRDSVLTLCKQPGEEVLSQYPLSAYKESVDPGSKEAQKYVHNLWQMLCPDDPLRLAQELMSRRWSMDKDKVKEYEAYLENYPEGPYAQQIETAIHHFYRHTLRLSSEGTYPSRLPITVELKAGNVSEATVVVYALPDTLNTLYFDYSNRKNIEFPVKEVVRRSVTFTPDSDLNATATVHLGRLPYGIYCVDYYEEAHPHKPLKTFKRGSKDYFCVSDLYPVSVADYTKGTHTEMVVDNWSGQPLDDVIFENGYPKRGNDRFCLNRINEAVDQREYSPRRADEVKFFSDLAIYRPGEQVRWHLVAYIPRLYTHSADPDALFKVTVFDANGEELRCDTVTTDAMGQARGSFVLPKGDKVPLGDYSIRVSQLGMENEYIAPYSFEVAEYKAPTFDVSIDRFASKYQRNDTVQIAGSVATLVGVPMRRQVVKLRVDGGEESIERELTTDEMGRFSMQLPMAGFFADSTQWHYWHWFTATVSVTNAGGESQEAQAGFHCVPDTDGKPYVSPVERPDTCPAGVPLWMRRTDLQLESDDQFNAVIPIYNSVPDAYIHYLAYDRDKILFDDWVHYADTGRHELRLPMLRKGSKVEMTVELFSRYQGRNYSCAPTVHLKERKLVVETEVMRDHLTPGVTETWRLRAHYDDEKCTPAQARLMLLLYHSALAQLRDNRWTFQPHVDRGPMAASFCQSYDYHGWSRSYEWTDPTTRKKIEMRLPQLQTWGNRFRFSHPIYIRGNAKVSYRKQDADFDDYVVGFAADTGVCEEEEAEGNMVFCVLESSPVFGAMGETRYPSIASTVQMRDSMTHVALYEPALDTDAEGRATVTFNVPQDNATWLLEAVAYDCALHTADLHKKIVVQRPVMVKPSLPRFVRMDDQCTLSGLVQNASEDSLEATVQVEIFHPLSKEVLLQKTEKMQLAVNEERALGITLQVPDTLDEIGFRIVAIVGAGEERCSDGEQLRLPILAAAQPIVDSYPFYVHQGADISQIKDSLWHVAGCPEKYTFEAVTNLKDYLRPQLEKVYDKDASSATAIAHSLWAQVVVNHLCDTVGENSVLVERLNGLQNADGGYSWCDYENRKSSDYVTCTVMYLMERLETMGYETPEGLHLDRVRQYLKDSTDYYSHTLKKKWYIRRHWRQMSLADRGFAAQYLYENASGIVGCFNKCTARKIARSIMEYQKEDDYYGGYWSIEHARNWNMPLGCCCCIWRPLLYHDQLALTAHLTEVLNEVDPVKYHEAIKRSRQWMMMSKRTTDWGNSSLVADAAYALLRTGDVWDDSSHPVWGALQVSKVVPVREVEKHSMHEVTVDVKPLEALVVGKKIKVEVQVEATQNMDYVTIIIPRPACLEPLRQTSGHFWQSGLWGKCETRDTETRLYLPHLTTGKHTLSFEAYVTHEGEFAQPAVTLTCEYNPQFTVHSAAHVVEVNFP